MEKHGSCTKKINNKDKHVEASVFCEQKSLFHFFMKQALLL